MFKVIGLIFLVSFLIIMFVAPVRNYMNNLFRKDNAELKEEQTIGTVSIYNPRVEEIQRVLRGAGFQPGPIDGRMGYRTRAAIREFQQKMGLKPSGKIDSTTQLALNREKEMPKQTPETKSDRDLSLEPTTQIDFKTEYITEYIKVEPDVAKEKKDRVRQIQIALKRAGFYKGEIDGKVGPQTKGAIKAFQKSKNLAVDGIVGPRTWEELTKYLKD